MEPRTALAVSIATATLAVAIVGLDSVWSLAVTIQSEQDGGWETIWTDPTQDRYADFPRPFYGACYGPTFRLLADNDKPLPDRVHVRVTYWDDATDREIPLVDETLRLGPFETQTVEWTVPPNASAPAGRFAPDEKDPPPFVHVLIDGGWPDGHNLDFCVREAGA